MTHAINPAVAAVEAPPIMEAQGWIRPGTRQRKLLNLCQAVPNWPPAEALSDEVARRSHEAGTSLYTDILGLPELRRAVASHMSTDYAGSIAPEDVAVTAGCNQAFAVALMALAGAGDNVLLPSPYFFNHTMWLAMLGIEARCFPARSEASPWPDPAAAVSLIDGRTRAIILCTPNNPTGAIYPPSVIEGFFAVARRHGLALVTDETYKDFREDGAPPHHLFARQDWRESFIHLYSFSKAFSITGYRVGSIVAGPAFLAQCEKIMDCMAICAPHIGQRAALFGLEHLEDWKRDRLAVMARKLAALRSALARPGLGYELASSGALFAYLKHPFTDQSAKDVARRLAHDFDVLCLPGSMFGPGEERYLRMALANAEAKDMETLALRLAESQGYSTPRSSKFS
jgi:aspartate/methionine/tyrosine aminotransferase